MKDDVIKDLTEGIPELFYDIIAYLIPPIYLMLGIGLTLGWFEGYDLKESLLNENVVVDLFIIFILIGILYLIGQLLTTLSSFVVWEFPRWVLNRLRRDKADSNAVETIDWYEGYRIMEIKRPKLANLITKRYARWVTSRNIVLATLILLVMNLILGKSYSLLWFGLLIVFSFDTTVRKIWLNKYINQLVKAENS